MCDSKLEEKGTLNIYSGKDAAIVCSSDFGKVKFACVEDGYLAEISKKSIKGDFSLLLIIKGEWGT